MGWKVEEYDNAISERSIRVIADDGETICCNEPYYATPLKREHADLIAAAPDMLVTLQAVRGHLVRMGWGETSIMIEGIEAAIAKAEGKP